MLTVYRSNKAEWLAKVLAEKLRLDPPDPFEETEIIVNTWPASRWLGEEIATISGINALTKFPFPGARLRELGKIVNGIEDHDKDPWIANQLVWQVIEVFPTLIEIAEAKPLKEWVSQYQSPKDHLNHQIWQLARTIADIFDDYCLYRTELITEWWNSNDNQPSNRNQLPKQILWQPVLLKLLKKKIKRKPFCLLVKDAVKKISEGSVITQNLPRTIHLFGISSLAPSQVDLIQALSGIIEINFYLLTPSPDLWQRVESRRKSLGPDWTNPLEGDWLYNSTRLEGSLGRMGAEFQQLLEGTGESQLGEWGEGNLFASSKEIARNEGREATLIEQLQEQLVSNNLRSNLTKKPQDDSLIFISCPGETRQVHLVRDQILKWLSEDETLEPRDILIMTPQIESFAPIICSVFSDKKATNVNLPWRITDRSQVDSPGLIKFMVKLLEIASLRLTASSLESLLENKAFQEQNDLTSEEVSKICLFLQETGFRWGLNSLERDGDEVHSLGWCLERWILGLVFPEEQGISFNEVAPFSKGLTPPEIKKWWELLSTLSTYIKLIRDPHTPKEWIKILSSISENIFGESGIWGWEYQSFLSALEDWRKESKDCDLKLDVSIVLEILKQSLNANSGRFGHRSGALTISALEPMRAIPHKIIVLMGLDSSSFPRQNERPGFHLLANKRQVGDPKSSDQDRYAILEALMSTRKHLLITWNNRNEKTGEVIPPSNPIQQWLTQLKKELGTDNFNTIFKEPHPNPLARNNFLSEDKNPPISCDSRNLDARRLLDKKIVSKETELGLPFNRVIDLGNTYNEISDEVLKEWLINPQLMWLEKLGIKPKEWIDSLDDIESLKLKENVRCLLIKKRFEEMRKGIKFLKDETMVSAIEGDWLSLYKGQGLLPRTNAGLLEVDLLEQRWQSLQSILLNLGGLKEKSLTVNQSFKRTLYAGSNLVIVEFGLMRFRSVVESWITHLQLCANNTPPHKTILIARSQSRSKKDCYEIALGWNPMSKEIATEELRDLKRLAEEGLMNCWPVPPESGWALAMGNLKKSDLGKTSFKKKWEGNLYLKGEIEKPEMKLCFGSNFSSNSFLENEIFNEAFHSLYDRITNHLSS